MKLSNSNIKKLPIFSQEKDFLIFCEMIPPTLKKKKKKLRKQKFKETEDSAHIYKIDLDKACFQHDMAYGDFKDLAGRTASHKCLKDKAFNIAKNPKYDGFQRGLASMV